MVHGPAEKTGHAFLTPGTARATADLTSEVLIRMVNYQHIKHGQLPPHLRIQLDSASVNRNFLVLLLLAKWVGAGVFQRATLQFLLEYHAHELIDAFINLIMSGVREASFDTWAELEQVMKDSVDSSARKNPRKLLPEELKTWRLIRIRDLWSAWSASGVQYRYLSDYRCFELRLEPGVGVVLYAKPYLSSPDGDLLRVGLFHVPEHPTRPTPDADLLRLGLTSHKAHAAATALTELHALQKSKYGAQWRLDDAIDLAAGDWSRFEDPDDCKYAALPYDLARLQSESARQVPCELESGAPAGPRPTDAATAQAAAVAQPPRRPVPVGPEHRRTSPPAVPAGPPLDSDALDRAWERWQSPVTVGTFALCYPEDGGTGSLCLYRCMRVFGKEEGVPEEAQQLLQKVSRSKVYLGQRYDTAARQHRGQLWRKQVPMCVPDDGPGRRSSRKPRWVPEHAYFCQDSGDFAECCIAGGFSLEGPRSRFEFHVLYASARKKRRRKGKRKEEKGFYAFAGCLPSRNSLF